MVKQLECKDIKEYLKTDTKKVLLDVRTQEEWNQFGKPDGEKLGLKTYFLTIQDENGAAPTTQQDGDNRRGSLK